MGKYLFNRSLSAKTGFLSALVLFGSLAAVFVRPKEHTWGVYFSGLPERVYAELAGEDVVFYILKQTHEPVFRRDDGQNYSSDILKSWSRSVDSSKYVFCPDTTLSFDKNHPFNLGIFKDHIASVTGKYSPEHSVTQNSECVVVNFGKSRKGYLEYLTRYENAPTLRLGGDAEVGLGEFYVEGITPQKVVLKRKKKCARGYDSVIVREYDGVPDWTLTKKDLKDFNRVPVPQVPAEISNSFLSFESIPLKSVGLIINIPDRNLRRLVYNCIDVDALRRAVSPNVSRFYNIETLLPVGVPGGKAGRPVQACGRLAPGQIAPKPLVFANWRNDSREKLQAFANSFYARTGVKMEIKCYDPYELVKKLFKRPHPYELVLIGFSVVQPEYDVFFTDLFKKDGLIDFGLPQLASVHGEMMKEEESAKKTDIAVRLAAGLAKEGAVLPIYQEMHEFYYPAEIKNLTVGKNFTEYPEVADFRW